MGKKLIKNNIKVPEITPVPPPEISKQEIPTSAKMYEDAYKLFFDKLSPALQKRVEEARNSHIRDFEVDQFVKNVANYAENPPNKKVDASNKKD